MTLYTGVIDSIKNNWEQGYTAQFQSGYNSYITYVTSLIPLSKSSLWNNELLSFQNNLPQTALNKILEKTRTYKGTKATFVREPGLSGVPSNMWETETVTSKVFIADQSELALWWPNGISKLPSNTWIGLITGKADQANSYFIEYGNDYTATGYEYNPICLRANGVFDTGNHSDDWKTLSKYGFFCQIPV